MTKAAQFIEHSTQVAQLIVESLRAGAVFREYAPIIGVNRSIELGSLSAVPSTQMGVSAIKAIVNSLVGKSLAFLLPLRAPEKIPASRIASYRFWAIEKLSEDDMDVDYTSSQAPSPVARAATSCLRAKRMLLITMLASGFSATPIYAQSIVANGDVNPPVPSPPPSIWNIGGRLYVGQSGSGTLTIADGAIVNNSNGYVGGNLGSNGVVAVDGVGSAWQSVGNLYIGDSGTGRLNVTEGGLVTSRDGYIGNFEHSTGTAVVSGVGSNWRNTRNFYVGVSGGGTLVIEDGGRVSSDYSYVGLDSSGNGSVTLTGAGSTWVNTADLTVGDGGSGLLSIQSGSTVSNAFAYVGNFFDSNGRVLVSGTGSTWSNSDTLSIGNGGVGTLSLEQGGRVSVQGGTGNIVLGRFAGSSGTLNIGAASLNRSDATGAGVLDAGQLEFADGTATLNFNHTENDYTLGAVLISTGAGVHRLNHVAGTTTLNANNSSFNGTSTVVGGTLIVADQLGGAAVVSGGRLQVDGSYAGPVAIRQSGTLAGVGTVSGSASFTNGGVLVGTQGQTLTIGGDLTLNSATQVNVALGGAATPALFNIAGALTLDGTLNITSQGGFGLGVYRLFDYQGTLTDNGLDIGTTPSGVSSMDLFLQSAANQINLVYSAGATLNFWDGGNPAQHTNGVINGGSGIWRADGSNWTTIDGAINGPFLPNPNFAIFQGAAGTVMVDNTAGAIGVTGLQIATDGYRIEGDAIALQGGSESIIRVGDSSAASASMIGTLDVSLSGASTLVKTDFGTLVLSGNNSYSGGTDIRGGVLTVSSDANLGAAAGTLTLNGGAFASTASFNTGRTVTLLQEAEINVASSTELGLSGSLTGSGSLFKSGAGTLILSGSNSYLDTRVASGTLIGNTDSISGNLLNSAVTIFDQATDATYAGRITGRGTATKRGTGALTLSDTSLHNWRIEAGSLISSADRYIGNTQIDAAGALRFEQASNATYSGVLSGNGAFTKTGAGQLTLTGNSSTFTGQTDVQSGTLMMGNQSQLGGSLNIASGATLQGTGRVGTTVLQRDATLAPGPGIGNLRVAGDLTFASGAIYRVEADPNSAASDRIAVTGTANLNGSVVHVGPSGGFATNRQYTILSANALQGQFATVSSNYAYLNPTLLYSAQDVTLQLVRKQAAGAFADAALTDNQRATANGLDTLPADNPLLEYILTLPEGAPPAVFDSLSGELHASVASSLLGSATTLRSLPLSHLRSKLQADAGRSFTDTVQLGMTRPADNEQPLWAELVGNRQTLQSDGNAAEVKHHSSGLLIGTDKALDDGWQLGGALGFTNGNLQVNERASKADLSNYSAALFGGKAFEAGVGQFNLLLGAAYTWHDINTKRHVRVAGAEQTLSADYTAHGTQLFSELGYALPLSSRAFIEPFAGLAWSDVRTSGFSESGGSAALKGKSASAKQTNSTLGVRVQSGVDLGGTTGQLRAMLGWQHALDDVKGKKSMAFDGGQPFTVAGAPIARDTLLVGLGADVVLTRDTRLGLNYSGQYGKGNSEHTGMLTLSWSY
jgi:outer membrane autotransporter protein